MTDTYYLQIRAQARLRTKIAHLARRHGLSAADIVRSSLTLGLRILEKLLEAQEDTVKEYIKLLRRDFVSSSGNQDNKIASKKANFRRRDGSQNTTQVTEAEVRCGNEGIFARHV